MCTEWLNAKNGYIGVYLTVLLSLLPVFVVKQAFESLLCARHCRVSAEERPLLALEHQVSSACISEFGSQFSAERVVLCRVLCL